MLELKYGKDKPFEDDELIPTIVSLSYPEIQAFFDTYVTGSTPIPYDHFLDKVGVKMTKTDIETSYFFNGQVPYIDGDPATNNLFFRENIALNSFLEQLGVHNGDVIKSVNNTDYSIENVYDLIMESQSWEAGEDITIVVDRDNEEVKLTGKITQPTDKLILLKEMELPGDNAKVKLRKAWLKN